MLVTTYAKVIWEDFVSIIYPKVCIHCNNNLFKGELYLCTKCRFDLPITNYHIDKNNPLYCRLSYIKNLGMVASYLFFYKKGVAQSILHSLKYRGQYKLGVLLGTWYASHLIKIDLSADYIIPVPLHSSKMKIRGYNQSMAIAEGFSAVMKIPIKGNIVKRMKKTVSQTRKSKVDRWKNVSEIFNVEEPNQIKNKSILLIDDAITTGATISSLCDALNYSEVGKINIFCLATGIK